MARYEPSEDPHNVPTRYTDHDGAQESHAAGNSHGPTDYQAPAEEPRGPWYLRPGVLMVWGALVAFLLAVVIWGIVDLTTRDSQRSTTPATTTVTTTAVAPPRVTTTTATKTSATTTAPTSTQAPRTTAEAPAVTTTTGGFHLPHMPTQFTLPKLPTAIELPPRR